MPVKPQAFTCHCPACGWTKTVAPKSDVLMPGEVFDACPKCGNTALERKQASALDLIAQTMLNFVGPKA